MLNAHNKIISLISHASKVLQIIRNRLPGCVRREVVKKQFDFVPGEGTTGAIIGLIGTLSKRLYRNMIKRSLGALC